MENNAITDLLFRKAIKRKNSQELEAFSFEKFKGEKLFNHHPAISASFFFRGELQVTVRLKL